MSIVVTPALPTIEWQSDAGGILYGIIQGDLARYHECLEESTENPEHRISAYCGGRFRKVCTYAHRILQKLNPGAAGLDIRRIAVVPSSLIPQGSRIPFTPVRSILLQQGYFEPPAQVAIPVTVCFPRLFAKQFRLRNLTVLHQPVCANPSGEDLLECLYVDKEPCLGSTCDDLQGCYSYRHTGFIVGVS